MTVSTPLQHVASATSDLPVVVVGAGPVGLVTALGLVHHGVPVVVLEEDDRLSLDTKAGTVLTRTLEVLDRYEASAPVLAASLRIDEIGEIDRPTGRAGMSVRTHVLTEETRFPFVVNIPQNSFEAVLEDALKQRSPQVLHMQHRVTGFTQHPDHVTLSISTPEGERTMDARYVLGCDGGRSPLRTALGITVEGRTLEERYMLVDLKADLDVDNPRDYPYLAYFADPQEWMILVRQPHCWRFLFPLKEGAPEPGPDELRDKALHFIGDVRDVEVLGSNIYAVHQRVANRWADGRIFLMGDAAHLITPMWALGLNTGVLDASNLPWRLAWVVRGWGSPALLDAYENEQSSVAIKGSGQMAEAARQAMGSGGAPAVAADQADWGWAMTRTLLGVRLDVEGTGEWTMVQTGDEPGAVRAGDRAPDLPLFDPAGGRTHLHELVRDSFVALHFTDSRRRPALPDDTLPGLRHVVVSRWDAPHDSGLRDRSFFDPGDRVRRRLGLEEDAVVLLRPDAHVAAVLPWPTEGLKAADVYRRITHPDADQED
ncbi:FAD-dependent monooxygenase [Actinotalea sp. Marseille-Q4924]|uniref:FAD-dependent monooxygenase n=1 Tax=Actinotalea sp. Marseille-Q4924 TaxID=2866571 RepID=UPI001CE3D6D5|nr:FAD-dependent monooxygenase [Actinotalea sp. Marseille-Q4924]